MDSPAISRDGRVPYRALERAVREAREQFPNAHRIKPQLSNGCAAIELWETEARGRVIVPEWAR